MQFMKGDFWKLVRLQYQYKMALFHARILLLIFVQIIAIALSFNSESTSMGMDNFSISLTTVSGMMVYIFTFIWAFIQGLHFNSKAATRSANLLPSTHLVHHTSNALLIISFGLLSSVMTVLSQFVVKVIVIFVQGDKLLFIEPITIWEILHTIIITALFMILILSLAYLLGSLSKKHPIYILILPVLLFFYYILGMQSDLILESILFFAAELNTFILLLKVAVFVVFALGISFLLDRFEEVPR